MAQRMRQVQWLMVRSMKKGAEKLGLKIEEYIANNDAYEYLKQTGCLLMTGQPGQMSMI